MRKIGGAPEVEKMYHDHGSLLPDKIQKGVKFLIVLTTWTTFANDKE